MLETARRVCKVNSIISPTASRVWAGPGPVLQNRNLGSGKEMVGTHPTREGAKICTV